MSALGLAAAAAPTGINISEWATPVVVALVGGVVSIIVARSNRKAQAEQNFIDQLQEEAQRAAGRIDKLEAVIVSLEVRQMVSLNYIYLLRAHIDGRLPPPPPEWPEAMLQR